LSALQKHTVYLFQHFWHYPHSTIQIKVVIVMLPLVSITLSLDTYFKKAINMTGRTFCSDNC
jgi:hypothetical protein